MCCKAMIASCLACGKKQTVRQYCRENPKTVGCKPLKKAKGLMAELLRKTKKKDGISNFEEELSDGKKKYCERKLAKYPDACKKSKSRFFKRRCCGSGEDDVKPITKPLKPGMCCKAMIASCLA